MKLNFRNLQSEEMQILKEQGAYITFGSETVLAGKKIFFSRSLVNRWKRLNLETVDVGSINSLKIALDKNRKKNKSGFLWILYGPQCPRSHGAGTT